MKEFYYQIKILDSSNEGFSRYEWPPSFSDKVIAISKEDARQKIEKEFGHKLPMKATSSNNKFPSFIIHITEIKPNSHISRLFDEKICKTCGKIFTEIEKYQTRSGDYYSEYCSKLCKPNDRIFEYCDKYEKNPVIYMITNLKTGLHYIGKTRQAFTLRWWQHFTYPQGTKFHKAIEESSLTDWNFKIVEVVDISQCNSVKEIEDFSIIRERFYIEKYDTINKGYNSI